MSEPDPRDPRLDDAYRDAPRDEPPPEADERIRAAARRAVDARPAPFAKKDRVDAFARWRVPLSVAATVVLAVTVALMVDEEDRRPRDDSPAVPAAAPQAKPPPPAPAESDAGPRQRDNATTPATRADEDRNTALQKRRSEAPAAPPPVQEREGRQAAPGPASSGALPEAVQTPAPAARAQETETPKARSEPLPDSPVRQRMDPIAPERPSRPARDAASALAPPRSAEEWIEVIRRLKSQGLEAEATAELAEFRRRHPSYALPADLLR
jgi:hypothetical protein